MAVYVDIEITQKWRESAINDDVIEYLHEYINNAANVAAVAFGRRD